MWLGVFLIPIFVILVFNTVIFVLVIRVLIKHSRKKFVDVKKEEDRKKSVKVTIKTLISVISIMTIFGMTWVFGFFTIREASQAFQWLFVLFNSLQGFFLFFFFCLLAQDAREDWIDVLTCNQRKKNKKKKKGSHTPSHTSGTGPKRPPYSSRGGTDSSYLSSSGTLEKTKKSRVHGTTMRRIIASGIDETSYADSSALELSTIYPDPRTEKTPPSDDLVFSNDSTLDSELLKIVEKPESDHSASPDMQVPPHVMARLQNAFPLPLSEIVSESLSDIAEDELPALTATDFLSDLDNDCDMHTFA